MALIDVASEFGQTTISGISLNNPTTLQIGPDGRLYVGQQNGQIKVADLTKTAGGWEASNVQTITLVQDIPNHNDDGALNTAQNNRQVTGLRVEEDASGNPVIYVTSSDPRIGAGGSGTDTNLDTNSGIISRITVGNDGTFATAEKVDLVIGLPRSEENHSTNGLSIRTELVDGQPHQIAYVASGGHDNKGAPSHNFAWTPEYYYSAAVLRVDLTQLEAMEADLLANGGLNGGTAYVDSYVYALPTLDDPTRANTNGVTGDGAQDSAAGTTGPADAEAADTFGGNDGLNQAKFDLGGPVQVYSPGYRNTYDIAITEAGNIYTFDNGPNNGWGGEPVADDGVSEVNDAGDVATNRPNLSDNTNDSDPDNLHLVTEGFYAGHPNPTRAAGAAAGLYQDQASPELHDPLPADWDTITGGNTNPIEGVYMSPDGNPGPHDGSIFTIGSSSNGLTEYTADGMSDNAAAEVLAVASFNGNITFMEIVSDGSQGGTSVTDSAAIQVGGTPLDLWAVGNGGIDGAGTGAGAVFVAQFGSNNIVVLEPDTPPVATDDQDFDGILDRNDPLQFDPTNGTSTVIGAGETLLWNLNPAGNFPGQGGPANGPYNIGFTGWMVNGVGEINPALNAAEYITDLDNTIRGGAPGVVQIKSVTDGDAYTTNNSQQDALQTGFTPGPDVADFTIRVPIFNPFSSVGLDENYGSVGFALGDGTQSNYIKVVAGIGGGQPRLQILYEENDAVVTEINVTGAQDPDFADLVANATGNALIDLYLTVDLSTPGAATAQAYFNYELTPGGGHVLAQPKAIGNAVSLQGTVLAAVLGQHQIADEGGTPLDSAAVVTFLATSFGPEDPFQANFADLEISANGFPSTSVTVADQAEMDAASPTSGIDTVVFTGPGAITVPDGFENLDLSTNASDGASVTLNGANNAVTAGPGAHNVDLGGGDDNVTGDAAALDGDSFGSFGEGDVIAVTGADPAADIVSVTAGAGTQVAVDTTGDGVADTTFTLLDGDVEAADLQAEVVGGTLNITLDEGPGTFVIGINSGGGTITGVTQVITDPDTATGGAGLDLGGQTISFNADNNSAPKVGFTVTGENNLANATNGDAQAGTDVDPLFQTERWGDYAYEIDVADGVYTVDLYFSEQYNPASSEGARIFSVNIEGGPVEVSDLDIVAAVNAANGTTGGAGADFAYGLRFEDIVVSDGQLTIDTIPGAEDNPKISGIAVFQKSGDPLPDTTAPTVASITAVPVLETPGNDAPIDIAVVFEDETGLDIDSITAATLTASAGAPTITLIGLNAGAQDGDTTVTATYQATSPSAGGVGGWPINTPITFTVDGVADEGGNVIAPASDTVTFTDVDPGAVLYRVNAGGAEIAAGDGGPAWMEDQSAVAANNTAQIGAPSPYLVDRGVANDDVTYGDTTPPGPGINTTAAPDGLFVTERYSELADPDGIGYAFAVADGEYTVNLYFDELFFEAAGERVFDVEIEGALVLDDFDTFASFGHDSGVQSFSATVVDGVLNIEFIKGAANNPHVAAIEIIAAEPLPKTVAIADAPTLAEAGDTGETTLLFPLTSTGGVDGDVDLAFTVNGVAQTATVTFTGGSATLAVDVANDDVDDGNDLVAIADLAVTAPADISVDAAASAASGIVTEDDADVAPGTVLYRINVGGPEVAAADGSATPWAADTSASPSPYVSGGPSNFYNGDSQSAHAGPIVMGDPSIPDSAPAEVFNTERWDPATGAEMAWAFPVDPGATVEVTLLFAELFGGVDAAGERLIDVEIEGVILPEFDDIDPFAVAGAKGAFARTATVTVEDGSLDIELIHNVENPALKGIEIRTAEAPGPVDSFNGAAAPGGDFSDDNADPTDVALALGVNTLIATQDFSDLDYVTFGVQAGQQLVAVNLTSFDGGTDSAFLGLQTGDTFPDEGVLAGGGTDISALLDGGTLVSGALVGTDILDELASTTIEGYTPETTVAGLTTPLGAGTYTLWFSQNQGPSQTTLELVTETAAPKLITISDAPDVVEGGDAGTTALAFGLSSTGGVDGDVSVEFSLDGGVTTEAATITFAGGTATLVVEVANDDDDDGPDIVSVTGLAVTAPADVAVAPGGGSASGTVLEDDAAVALGALVTVSGSTTFGTGSVTIENTSDAGVTIVGVRFDIASATLSTGLDASGAGAFAGAVFDPTGEAGDQGSQGLKFTGNAAGLTDGAGTVLAPTTAGIGYVGTGGVYPFTGQLPGSNGGAPGGYRYLDLAFASFAAGLDFTFGVDVDPQSIQGASGTGEAGAVSGLEIAGTTVEITFEDASGQQYTRTSQLWGSGDDASQAVFGPAAPLAAPELAIAGLIDGTTRRAETASDTHQVEVTGVTEGQEVRLFVFDASGYQKNGGNGTETLPADPFHANQIDAFRPVQGAVVGAGETSVAFTVDLSTDIPGAAPATQDGLFYLAAGIFDAGGAMISLLSEGAVLKLVDEVAGAPVAGTDAFSTPVGQTVFIPFATLLANDSDPDGDPGALTVVSVASTSAEGALVTIAEEGVTALYGPPTSDFVGLDSFTYEVADLDGNVTTGTVEVTVTAAIVGTPGPDPLAGSDLAERFYGDGGDDDIDALGGDDIIFGFSGDDVIDAGSGNDQADGEAGDDTLFGGAGRDFLYGGLGADTIHGGDDTDALFGGADGDTLYGEGGGDNLDGGAGDDTLIGGDGVDWLFGQDGADILDGGAETDALFGGAGDDTLLGGAGGDNLDGGADDDTLFGGDGVDYLYGQGGADILAGGAGLDALFGGAGADVFRLEDGFGEEQIFDFEHGLDRIDVSSLATGLGDLSIGAFGAGHLMVTAAGSDASALIIGGAALTLAESDFIFGAV